MDENRILLNAWHKAHANESDTGVQESPTIPPSPASPSSLKLMNTQPDNKPVPKKEAGEEQARESQSETLLPCPFCGSVKTNVFTDGFGMSVVSCYGCGCQAGNRIGSAAAIDEWNRRVKAYEREISQVIQVLEKADLCKVSESHEWANVISEARILCDRLLAQTDKQDSPVHKKEDGEAKREGSETTSPDIRTRKAREWWMNVYTDDGTAPVAHKSKDRADREADPLRFECVHVREVVLDHEENIPQGISRQALIEEVFSLRAAKMAGDRMAELLQYSAPIWGNLREEMEAKDAVAQWLKAKEEV